MMEDVQNGYIEEIRDYCRRCDNGRNLDTGSIVLSLDEHCLWNKGEKPNPEYSISFGVVRSISNDSIGIETTVKYSLDSVTGLPNSKSNIKQQVVYYERDCCNIATEELLRSNCEFSELANIVF